MCRKLRIFGKFASWTPNFFDFLYKMVEKEVFEQDYIPLRGPFLQIWSHYVCVVSLLFILILLSHSPLNPHIPPLFLHPPPSHRPLYFIDPSDVCLCVHQSVSSNQTSSIFLLSSHSSVCYHSFLKSLTKQIDHA